MEEKEIIGHISFDEVVLGFGPLVFVVFFSFFQAVVIRWSLKVPRPKTHDHLVKWQMRNVK